MLAGGSAGTSALADTALWIGDSDSEAGHGLAVGDVNDDGADDLFVGAPGEEAVYLITAVGTGGYLADIPSRISSSTGGDRFGMATGLADLNGDGCPDLAIGAPEYNGSHGQVFVYWGGSYPLCGAVGGFTTEADADVDMLGNNLSTEEAGTFVLGTDDLTGDGLADLLVGAPDYGAGLAIRGRMFLIEGSATLSSSFLELLGVKFELSGHTYYHGALLGSDAVVGDVNQDTVPDLVLGVPGMPEEPTTDSVSVGHAVVFYGPLSNSSYDVQSDGDAIIRGSSEDDLVGMRVGMTDQNGDGAQDLAVSADGSLHLFLGGPGL